MCSASNQGAMYGQSGSPESAQGIAFFSLCLSVSVFVILDKGPLRDT
jgi:hypothetical protein